MIRGHLIQLLECDQGESMCNRISKSKIYLRCFRPDRFNYFHYKRRAVVRSIRKLPSALSSHPIFCHSRMPEGMSANLSWTRTTAWTILRVPRRLIGEHEASLPPICLIFREWKIFKCCRCCFIPHVLVRVVSPQVLQLFLRKYTASVW